ncbi:MAG: hypothetical protein OEX12_09705 [Gammaproteobacteria bacterium]|nr:hypothetical protein [Gammaproteobacteria bacterium]
MAQADDYHWVVGKWQLSYDPDGSKTDYLEFFANGDVVSSGDYGEVRGFYIAAHGMVKAVLTVDKKDLILTFFHNDKHTQLRIVTSNSGKASVYTKMF